MMQQTTSDEKHLHYQHVHLLQANTFYMYKVTHCARIRLFLLLLFLLFSYFLRLDLGY